MNAPEALRLIADGARLPCRKCGEVHIPWKDSTDRALAPQWSSLEDGHTYWEMTPQEFARTVLIGGAEGAM